MGYKYLYISTTRRGCILYTGGGRGINLLPSCVLYFFFTLIQIYLLHTYAAEAEAEASYVAGFPVPLPLPPGPPVRLD